MTIRAIRMPITTAKSSPSKRGRLSLLIFAKAPIAGAVKTRLARDLGFVAAAAWYRRSLARTAGVAERSGIPFRIAGAPSAASFRSVSSRALPLCDQPAGDLGQRLSGAARRAPSAIIIVGSDIPDLSSDILKRAQADVMRFDLVLGPARDGGYYLIGLKTPAHAFRLFRSVRWSTPHTMADTLANVPKHWRIGFLPMLRDVDCVDDLKSRRANRPPMHW